MIHDPLQLGVFLLFKAWSPLSPCLLGVFFLTKEALSSFRMYCQQVELFRERIDSLNSPVSCLHWKRQEVPFDSPFSVSRQELFPRYVYFYFLPSPWCSLGREKILLKQDSAGQWYCKKKPSSAANSARIKEASAGGSVVQYYTTLQ